MVSEGRALHDAVVVRYPARMHWRRVGLSAVVGFVGCGGSTSTPQGDTGTSSSSGSTTTGSATTESSTSTSPTTSTGSEGTSTSTSGSDSTGSTSGDTGSSSTAADSTEASSSDTGAVHEACTEGCIVEAMCGTEWTTAEECAAWCEDNLDKAYAFSPFCAGAWENLSACFGTLDCEEFAEYEMAAMASYPCSEEAEALAFECEGQ